ncbi:hypothetical protein PoB_002178300 [Plakobranchus ocellatus]|uniref:Uncharacterized protein n=1 Tax=Plakobranchus ocellatus TaxID=259542 RepID=A0AAV3ZL16_9GAST|nr:hypothetical protein PoB_002178300 [Plakobranchus ocellatus]
MISDLAFRYSAIILSQVRTRHRNLARGGENKSLMLPSNDPTISDNGETFPPFMPHPQNVPNRLSILQLLQALYSEFPPILRVLNRPTISLGV